MKLLSLVGFIGMSTCLFAQDVILQGHTRRSVEKAERIAGRPMIEDTVIQQEVINYPLLSMQYQTKTEVDRIKPAKIRIKEQLDQLYTTYVKLGIGTELMPLGEIYFNNRRSRKFRYGANVKHLSSWGNIKGFERSTFDRTKATIYGGINEKRYQLFGKFHYRNQGLHYYAIPAPLGSLGKAQTNQRYNDFGLDANFKSNARIDTMGIDYKLGLKYNHFNTQKPAVDSLEDWRAKENYFDFNASGNYKLNENEYSVELSIINNSYKYANPTDSISLIDTALSRSNTIIQLAPTFKTYLWNDKFKATVGANLTLNIDNGVKFHIYPTAEVKYSMFNDMFIPYVGVRGGMKQNTLKSLTLENEFMRPNIVMQNQNTSIDIYGGFKGTLSKSISFNIGGGYAFIQNMPLFVNDTVYSPGNRFALVYDTAKVLTLEGSLAFQLRENLKVDAIASYRSYETKTNAFAWNKPSFEFITRVHYNLYDKFYANLDFKLETGRKALVYAAGKDVYEENLQFYRKLQAIYDFNLSLEYRYTKRLSVFVQLNNIAAQRYQRWYNAPVHSFQFLGGLTFRL